MLLRQLICGVLSVKLTEGFIIFPNLAKLENKGQNHDFGWDSDYCGENISNKLLPLTNRL